MGLEGGETLATTVKKGSEEFSTIWWGLGSHSVSISTFCYFNAQFKLLTPSQVNSPLLFAASQLQYGRLTLLGAGGLNPSSLLCEIFLHEPS